PQVRAAPALPSIAAWRQALDGERLLAFGGLGLSALLLLLSLSLFPSGPPNTAAWWLYGLSMILMLAALPALDGRWSAARRRVRERPTVSFNIRSAAIWAALAAILLLGLLVRLYNIDELPAGFWYDEAVNLITAARFQQDPGSIPVFIAAKSVLYFLPTAVLIGVLGQEPEALRIVTAAFSVAGIFALFLLVRLTLGNAPALLAAFVLATMRWDINFARIGMVPATMPLFTALAAYLTLRALKTQRLSDFGYSGFVVGLGLWFYSGFQIFPIVIGAILLHHILLQRPDLRRFGLQIALMAVVGLAVVAPLAQFAVTDTGEFTARLRQTSIWSNRP
ncbi:MAG: glycosyltransferase family 39 protein, partial [Ardenticatenaceae bacterium]